MSSAQSDSSSGPGWHATTILSVRKDGQVVMAGDGQVSMGQTIVKGNAKKVRRIGNGQIIAGFAGATASGQAHLWGRGKDRRLNFDVAIKGADLGQAITTMEKFTAQRKNLAAPVKSAFLERTDAHLDLTASADRTGPRRPQR